MSFELQSLTIPIVGGPMAGASTPALAAAVSEAGGLGFLAAGYKTAEALAAQISETRSLTGRPFGVNVFAPQHVRATDLSDDLAAYAEQLAAFAERAGAEVGAPRFDDDAFDAKIDLLEADPVAVVTFTFGAVPADVVARLRRAGSAVGFTVTEANEARQAEDLGADLLVVQGADAGGHRGIWSVSGEPNHYDALALLRRLSTVTDLPLIAAGGVGGADDVRALLDAGASAVAVGTLFVAADESGAPEAYKDALTSGRYDETLVARSFSGRYARGLANDMLRAGDGHAPSAYPDVHHMTAPIRAAAAKAGDDSLLALWAGARYRDAVRRPAADIVTALTS